MLDLAYKALTAKYPAVSTKNRLGEPTHDVLCVIRYRGYLVEIQFHFRTVLALKSFSHAGFNILRMQTETAYDLGTVMCVHVFCVGAVCRLPAEPGLVFPCHCHLCVCVCVPVFQKGR